MNSYDPWNRGPARSPATDVATLPVACPSCEAKTITTTAKNPDENSYWRCSGCGEVWNASRRNTNARPGGGYRWR